MADIRLLMCYHRQYDTVPPMWEPIRCGAALSDSPCTTLSDVGEDDISDKNHEYCELTAHYYAWKNIVSNYYGFCHYRRFFGINSDVKLPYLALGKLSLKQQKAMLGDGDFWRKQLEVYDILVPRSEDMGLSVREHYITAQYHYFDDLQQFVNLLKIKAPQLNEAAEEYLAQNRQYFCNMFIMDRVHFNEYCEILFDTLNEFDKHKKLHGDLQADRTNGYLGEIFTGIYITYCRKAGVSIAEYPRLDVNCPLGKKMSYKLFPPESKRRFLAKRLVKRLRGK